MGTLDDAMVALNPDAMIATDGHGRVLRWNDGAAETFGFTAAESLGRPLTELTIPADRIDEHQRLLQDALESGTARSEAVRRRKDGSLIHVDVLSRRVGPAGSDCVLWVKRDVTQAKVLRDAKQVETRFHDLLESTPDGMLMLDETGHILLANVNAERLFGYDRGELRARPVELLLPARFRNNHVKHRTAYFGQPRVRSMGAGLQLFGLRKNGEEFPVEISLSPLKTDGGTLVMSAVRDITDRQRAAEKFRGLLEAAPDAIVIVDLTGRIVLANSQADRMFGYRRDDLVGQQVEMLLPQGSREVHVHHRAGFFEQPHVRAMGAGLELHARRKDGTEFPVEISLGPLETEDGTLVSAAIRDITEHKRLSSELQAQNLQLERANRAKSQFLASMSHELRTPLNAIIGFTGTLLMGLPGPLNAEQQKQLRTVEHAGRHLLALINDLLNLTRIEAGRHELELKKTGCRELAALAVNEVRPLADGKKLELTFEPPETELFVMADTRSLHQILLNLLGNAVKYTEKGRICLQVRASWTNPVPVVQFCVTDTGIGIAPGDHQRMFQAFSQVGQHGHTSDGVGLGLYLSSKLAETLGGTIDYVSTPGVGSAFTLTLPVA